MLSGGKEVAYGLIRASPLALVVKNSIAKPGDKETRLHPWVGKIPWHKKWQHTIVFLPGEFHGQRSLVGSIGLQKVGHD